MLQTVVVVYIYTSFAMLCSPGGALRWALINIVGVAFAKEWREMRDLDHTRREHRPKYPNRLR